MTLPAWERERSHTRGYAKRDSTSTALYQVVSAGAESLKQTWSELYESHYGALRKEVVEAFSKFLECGVLAHGCARAHCTNPECNHSELIPFSCKRRCLCPSCDAKRAVIFAEKLEYEVLLKLPHQHGIFTVPKRVRPYFKFTRANLSILYGASWQAWSDCVAESCPEGKTGAVMALHTASSSLAWHPHIHSLLLSGALLPDGSFYPVEVDSDMLKVRFEYYALKALVELELLSKEAADNILTWPHTGFSAYLGQVIEATDAKQRLYVARYLKKCPVSNKRLSLSTEHGETVVNLRAVRNGQVQERKFTVLSFLAELQQHIPDLWEQTSRFFGLYSCRCRGAERAKKKSEQPAPTLQHLPQEAKAPSPKWAALMKRVFEINPLECPRCKSEMTIKAFITDPKEINRICENLGIKPARAPPLRFTVPLAA